MPPLILLGLIAGIPLALLILLRVKPLYIFVSIVTGYFWVQYLGDTAELTLRSMVQLSHPEVVIRLVLLLLPVVLTFILMKKTLSARALPFQFVLLVANSLLLATLLVPLLTTGTQQAIYQTSIGKVFWQMHDDAIAGIAALHLIVMYVMRPRHHEAHGSKGKKHH